MPGPQANAFSEKRRSKITHIDKHIVHFKKAIKRSTPQKQNLK